MKKRKLLLLVPVASLFLSGCTFKEVKHAIGESWVGQHILHPVYDPVKGWIQDITGKEEKQGEGEKPTPEPEPVKVNYGTLEAPLSMKEFQETVDKLIDFEEVEEGTTVTHQTAPFYLKGKVVKNEAASNGKIRFTNLVDATDENVKVTGYYLTFGEGVDSATYGVADAMKGGEIVVKGYGMLYKKDGAKTYEIGEQSKEGEKGQILSVTMPEPTAEPEKLNRTLAEIVAGTPTKSQAYVSRAQIKYFASSGQAKTDESSEYGGMVITDGTNDVFVYGSSPVATDLSWNGTAGEYAYKSSKVFKTNDLTKDLQPGYYIDFYGIYFDYNGIKEMNLIITGAEAGELPPEVIPEGQTKVEKTATQLKEENDWVASAGQDVGTKFDGVDLDANIHVGFVGTGNTATYWTSGEAIRIYGDKGTSTTTVTFTGGEGVTIKSIKLTFSLTGNATFPLVSGTAADVDANSVTYPLTCAADANGQIRIAAFEVLYTGGVPTQKELQSISVAAPTDVDYFTGESLNTEGMVVMGHYLLGEEEVEEEIKTGYTLSQEGAFTENDIPGKTITVTYEGKTATFDVTVSKKAAELLNITIEGNPKAEYEEGEEYSLEGLSVVAHYDGEDDSDVTAAATLTVSKPTAEGGDEKITYTAIYNEKEATLEVDVHVTVPPKPDHAGTAEDPYTISDCEIVYANAKLEQGKDIGREVYVAGTILADPAATVNNGRGRLNIGDSTSENSLYIYNINNVGGTNNLTLADIPAGSQVLAKGTLKNYNGMQLCYVKDVANCEFISIEKPVIAPATIEITSGSELNVGSNMNLAATVGPEGAPQDVEWSLGEGDETYATLSNGVLTGVAPGEVTVTATAVDHPEVTDSKTVSILSTDTPTEKVYKNVAFLKGNSTDSISAYTAEATYTQDGFSVKTANFNNNKLGWDFIKCGRKNDASVATITTTSAIDKAVTKASIEFDAFTQKEGSSAKLLVSANADMSQAEEYDLTPTANSTVDIALNNPTANLYYQFYFDCVAGGSNGYIVVKAVSFSAVY